MKNNLIGAVAGWKSAALLALVAMVAAVAFSGVLTSNSADAQTTPEPKYSVTITVGESETVTVADLDSDISGVAASEEGGITFDFEAEDSPEADDDDDELKISVAESVYAGTYTVTVAALTDDGTTEDIAEDEIAVTVKPKATYPGGEITVTFSAAAATAGNNRYVITAGTGVVANFKDAPRRLRPAITCADQAPSGCDKDTAQNLTELSITIDKEFGQGHSLRRTRWGSW